MQIQLECTNVCNADCCFCPYSKMRRPKGTMSMNLFCRIIDEATSIPLIDHITITGLGEPLLDRFLIDRIRYVRKKMPGVLLDLYTNGTFLRPEMVDDLHRAGLSVLYVSLNAVTRDRRLQVMKLDDFDQVTRSTEYALTKPGWRVIVKGIVSKDLMEAGDNEAFTARWGGPFTGSGNAFLHLEGNWAGATWPMRLKPTEPCARALNQIMVLWDGRVSLCCFDSEGDCTLGDLNHQTIREVFNGQPALGIREAHIQGRRQELKLCNGCTGI